MKKYVKYILIVLLILISITNFNTLTCSIKMSFNICIKSLIPSIIPFLLLSNLLIKSNILEFNAFSLILLCIISGSPSNSKYLKEYIDNNAISEDDAAKLLNFLQYFNPIYIINIIGISLLCNRTLGFAIMISNIIGSLFLIQKVKTNNYNRKIQISFNILSKTILDIINTILYIVGIITTFFIITSYIDIIFNVNIKYKYLYGLFEITQGIYYLNYSNLNTYFKTLIASFYISFGGLSMHAQIFGILDNKKIRYKPYLISRLKEIYTYYH